MRNLIGTAALALLLAGGAGAATAAGPEALSSPSLPTPSLPAPSPAAPSQPAAPAPLAGPAVPDGVPGYGAGRLVRAQVVSRDATQLASPMAGRVVSMSVRDGETFEKGQELLSFDCALAEGQLGKARTVAEKTRTVLAAKQRLEKLGSVSPLELAVSEAEAKEAQADVRLMEVTVGRCRVLAPYAGRVAGVQVRTWQYVGEGQPLLDIVDHKVLEVEMIVPSRWLGWLGTGYRFDVQIDETGKRYTAEVVRLSGKVDAASQSIKVYASIVGPSTDLLPGMSGRALLDHAS